MIGFKDRKCEWLRYLYIIHVCDVPNAVRMKTLKLTFQTSLDVHCASCVFGSFRMNVSTHNISFTIKLFSFLQFSVQGKLEKHRSASSIWYIIGHWKLLRNLENHFTHIDVSPSQPREFFLCNFFTARRLLFVLVTVWLSHTIFGAAISLFEFLM